MIEYHPKCISEGNHRFALEQPGKNVLIIIGVNPSTADELHPDPTMKSVLRFVNECGYDGFVMLNLSSERSTAPSSMSNSLDTLMHKKNLEIITNIRGKYQYADVLLAFGNNIQRRDYLKSCLIDIYQSYTSFSNNKWLCIGGDAYLTKNGHPRHPLYVSPKVRLSPFDIDNYLRALSRM